MKKKVLIISYSHLKTDPRILRQISSLYENFEIHTAGLSAAEHIGESSHTTISLEFKIRFHLQYPVLLRKLVTLFYVLPIYYLLDIRDYFFLEIVKAYKRRYWNFWKKKTLEKLSGIEFYIIIANDIETLPLAILLKKNKGGKIYFDAHEYSPLEYENNQKWLKAKSPYYTFLCKYYIPFADYNTTVCKGIADAYHQLTGRYFDVVFNAPFFEDLSPSDRQDGIIKFVYHGAVAQDRNSDKLIKAFIQTKRTDVTLHLMIINLEQPYGQYIQKLAFGCSRIFFHEPVPTKEIASFINRFDVGIYFLPPLNFNQEHALPNKFFEYVQARLMLAFGPSKEMVEYFDQYGLGKVGTGFDITDMLDCINTVTHEEVMRYKQNVNKAALDLSAESSSKLVKINMEKLCVE